MTQTRKTRAGVLLALALCLPPAAVVSQTQSSLETALKLAVQERMGSGADVKISRIEPAFSGPFSRVTIDPAAKAGDGVWATLVTGPAATMRVRVTLSVVSDWVYVTKPIERGDVVTASNIATIRGVVAGVPLRRLPTLRQVVGGRALRPMAIGEIVQPGFVSAVPLVKAGEPVTAIARVAGVQASATFKAVDNGVEDEIIRIVNPETRLTLRARVVAAGTVEVLNVQ